MIRWISLTVTMKKWDGSGYPRGLKGEEIPWQPASSPWWMSGTLLTNDRPYRKAWSEEKTIAYIQEQSGTHFDPKAVKTFMKVHEQQRKNTLRAINALNLS